MAEKKSVTQGGVHFSGAEVATIKEIIADWLEFDTVRPPFPEEIQSVLNKLGLPPAVAAPSDTTKALSFRAPVRSQ